MSESYRDQRDFSSSLFYHQKALNMRHRLFGGKKHPDLATSFHHMGRLYYDQDPKSSTVLRYLI